MSKKIRYAVVGLGDIAQVAILPGFAHAANSELAALISSDQEKLDVLSRRYKVAATADYGQMEQCLTDAKVDAVFIALPNHLHCEYALRVAALGKHILCEKPLAPTVKECRQIIQACAKNGVKLMTAYRLHFEKSNLEAIEIVRSGRLGEPRIFQSLFAMQARPGNVRLASHPGGGPVFDLGVYCVNASRYLFRTEPTEVFAYSASNDDPRFRDIDEMTSAVLKFPDDRLASFTSTFGSAHVDTYTIAGTHGMLRMQNGYQYALKAQMEIVTESGGAQTRHFALRDQFGAEIYYFSDCLQRHREPEPDGAEGMEDVHIIESILASAKSGRPVKIKPLSDPSARRRPDLRQEIHFPPSRRVQLVKAEAPGR